MQPHTFEQVSPGTWKCCCCGRMVRPGGPNAPAECPGCLEIERMATVKVPPLSAADLEPKPKRTP